MPPAKRSERRLPRDAYTLTVRQCPDVGKSLTGKEKDRKPVDPPPIIQLQIRDYTDPAENYLQSPYYFCMVHLCDPVKDEEPEEKQPLVGTLCSSLHKLKDTNNIGAGFFIFPDISVKFEGEWRLKFQLWELLDSLQVICLQEIITKPFKVHPAKSFPGLSESTFLTRSFSDQGVRLRIRKETRSTVKRSASEAESSHYASQADAPGLGSGYGQSQYTSNGYPAEYLKRQKSASNSSYGDREMWAQTSPGLYGHPSHSQVSSYYQEPGSAAPQVDYSFRGTSAADPVLTAGTYYPRNAGIGDYGPTTHQLPYVGQPRSTQDVANGASSYGDNGSFGNLSSTDASQASQYRYNLGASVNNVLPPISSATSSSGQVLASSGYPTYGTDTRYPSVTGNGRNVYQYSGQGYQVPTNYAA